MQLAETSTIAFLSPIFIALLAGPLLGEWPGRARLAAIAVGFLGVLVATRPGAGAFQPVVLVAIAGALCNAGYALATRGVAGRDSGQTTLLVDAIRRHRRADAAAARGSGPRLSTRRGWAADGRAWAPSAPSGTPC